MSTRRRRRKSTNVRRQSSEDKKAKTRKYERTKAKSYIEKGCLYFFDNVTIVRGSKQPIYIYTLFIGRSGTKHRKYKCIVERDS